MLSLLAHPRSSRGFRAVINCVAASRPSSSDLPPRGGPGPAERRPSRAGPPVRVVPRRSYGSAPPAPGCWRCGQSHAERPAFFCSGCRAVQPPDGSASLFQVLGCNHSFTLDTQQLQKRYLQLQRTLHPDNFSQKTKEEQEYSEHQSALLNRAYRTLLKPLSRGLYMLELEGMPIEEGTDSAADPSFLMQLMELNEAVEEALTPEEANRIGQDTKVKLKELTAQIDDALGKGEHQAAKALLIQMKYFANIEEKVKEQLDKLM
ncbi:unnamed protein product [Merluccius merluccius]